MCIILSKIVTTRALRVQLLVVQTCHWTRTKTLREDCTIMDTQSVMLNDLTGAGTRQNPSTSRHVHYESSQLQNDLISSMPSHSLGASASSTLRKPRSTKHVTTADHFETIPILRYADSDLDNHAGLIAGEMEKDSALMEDNPESEQLRIDTLREMPESLTLKRVVKKKLLKRVSQKSKKKPIGCFKKIRYKFSMLTKKLNLAAKDVIYSVELWYSSIKVIEGHFGSSVATYFRFFRWLFMLNVVVALINVLFLAIPQSLYSAYDEDDDTMNNTAMENRRSLILFKRLKVGESEINSGEMTIFTTLSSSSEYFSFADIFVGEGSFTNSILYYGHYTNTSFSVFPNVEYSMPLAYFFTTACCFGLAFLALSLSVARSYRKVFIETSGGIKNVYAHKIFCGWDYSIATTEAANLKSKSLYNEIKELLAEDYKELKKHNWKSWLKIILVRLVVNLSAAAIFIGTGAAIWLVLEKKPLDWNYMLPLIITVIMVVAPWLLSILLRLEDYESPRIALYVNLVRVFLLEIVAIMAVVVYWFHPSSSQCWETSLGQELYRLVILDFFISTLGSFLIEFLLKKVGRSSCIKIAPPEFDITRNTLNLIYNETLVFVGFFYSPLLPLVVTIKMFITFYIKKIGTLYNCQPASRSWRASQTQTVFLILTFLSLLAAVIAYVYLISYVNLSEGCGPFQKKMSDLIMDEMLTLEEGHVIWKILFFVTKPGVVGIILTGMIFLAFYMRSKAAAHAEMIELLKDMLIIEAEDKEFLLTNIAKVTETQYPGWSDGRPKPSPRKMRKRQTNWDSPLSGDHSAALKGMRAKQPFHLRGQGHKMRR
ncbi:transmembrane channel-like protein 5 isoform X1 [Schistocerca nitens]|uniref:transmembrane channel-like protein 5 isoform X1 n=3 Tax=Schistocerca nitens TaxID=7011 RepID=UPI002118F6EF|nr:transmembrane channel-like protein 5 isoform X1 [Schistocerca nitens]